MATARPRASAVKESTFQWEGRNKDGKAVRGEMKAATETVVQTTLRRQDITNTKVKKLRFKTGGKITDKDITLFTRQLATMMKSGVPLLLSTEPRILRYRKVSGKGGDQFQLVLDRTPFYAEGGGQVGDQGWLIQGADQVEVIDIKRENQLIVHLTKELPKDVSKPLMAQVNTQRRGLTARNHTATHLLHHALRKHLGTHVEQKGSLVAPDRLRFDISHFAKVTPEELATIERAVNAMITDDIVFEDKRNVPIAEAKNMGAMALFGEKYGGLLEKRNEFQRL